MSDICCFKRARTEVKKTFKLCIVGVLLIFIQCTAHVENWNIIVYSTFST